MKLPYTKMIPNDFFNQQKLDTPSLIIFWEEALTLTINLQPLTKTLES